MSSQPYVNIKREGRTWLEHRWVYTQANGPIPDDMVIHHINFRKRDNRLENLQMMTHQEHSELHNQVYPLIKECAVCGDTFMPEPTKRKRAVTCSRECFRARIKEARTKIGVEGRADMLRLRVAGLTLGAIAAAHGVSFSTAQRIVKQEMEIAA